MQLRSPGSMIHTLGSCIGKYARNKTAQKKPKEQRDSVVEFLPAAKRATVGERCGAGALSFGAGTTARYLAKVFPRVWTVTVAVTFRSVALKSIHHWQPGPTRPGPPCHQLPESRGSIINPQMGKLGLSPRRRRFNFEVLANRGRGWGRSPRLWQIGEKDGDSDDPRLQAPRPCADHDSEQRPHSVGSRVASDSETHA